MPWLVSLATKVSTSPAAEAIALWRTPGGRCVTEFGGASTAWPSIS